MSNSSHFLSKQNSQQPKQFRGGEKKVMKKSLSLLVAIAMVFSMFATLVSADTKSAGEQLKEAGLINGTNEGLEEGAEWLRQDVTVLIARLLGKVSEAEAHANTHGFEDLDSKFYNGYVSWAKENELFIGKSETKFGVGEPITNQEFATVLLRVFKQLEGSEEEVDYATAFETAVALGLADKDLDPKANAIRGDIYTSLVSAIEYKINGKKVGTILGLKGYENNFAVSSAKATNSKTVAVEFSQEVGTVLASNFVVKEKDAENTFEVISSVSASDNEVKINLIDSLKTDKTYVVEVSGIANKDASAVLEDTTTLEFTYAKAEAASVALKQTALAFEQELGFVIKDAAGNDITADFDIANDDVVKLQSSNTDIIAVTEDNKLVAADFADPDFVGYSVVNVIVTVDAEEEKTIETGAIAVQVKNSVAVINSIGKVSLDELTKDAVTSLFKSETKTLQAEVLGADGKKVDGVSPTFKSLNPTVLVVDQTTGVATGIKAGSATVVVTANFNGKTVNKSVVITVKEDQKLAGIEVDKSSIKLVHNSDISAELKVTLKDQYGDVYKGADQDIKVISSKGNVVQGFDADKAESDKVAVNGEIKVEVAEHLAQEKDTASTVLTIQAGNFKKTVSVSVVKGGALVGYAVELSATKIDANDQRSDVDKDAANYFKHAINDKEVTVKVYAKDSAGNYLNQVLENVEVKTVGNPKAIEVVDGKVQPLEKGTQKIEVLVNNLRVGTYEITVVDTTATLSKVVQSSNAITVDKGQTNIEDKIIGTLGEDDKLVDGALVGYDQYGDKIQITNYAIVSANSTVVEVSEDRKVATAQDKADTVTLTVVFDGLSGSAYTVSVKVK